MPRYVLTDIHGCPKTMSKALASIQLRQSDELYLLGDYIDRGPDSLGVLRIIWKLEAEGYQLTCLRGNHEQMLIDYHDGKQHLYEWTPPRRDRKRTLDWMRELKYYHELPGYLLVHAGLNFRHANPLLDKDSMLWARYWYDEIDLNWLDGRVVIHGHTPVPRFALERQVLNMDENGWLGLDTGCSHDRPGMEWLTVFELDSRELQFFKKLD